MGDIGDGFNAGGVTSIGVYAWAEGEKWRNPPLLGSFLSETKKKEICYNAFTVNNWVDSDVILY